MGQQQGLHLPLALITVKIISDRRQQVEAGERGAEGEGYRARMMEVGGMMLRGREMEEELGFFYLIIWWGNSS